LEFRNDIEVDGDALTANVSDSHSDFLWGLYKIGSSPVDRVIGAPASPNVETKGHDWPVNETIDVSVFDRWRANKGYRPVSLAEWAKRLNVDPAKLNTSVMATKPAVAAPD
jgi:hypothetical protein